MCVDTRRVVCCEIQTLHLVLHTCRVSVGTVWWMRRPAGGFPFTCTPYPTIPASTPPPPIPTPLRSTDLHVSKEGGGGDPDGGVGGETRREGRGVLVTR